MSRSLEIDSLTDQNDVAGIDINDAFEEIFLTEERIIDESFNHGLEDGRQDESVKEAFDYGFKKASEIGHEIGFYYTIVIYAAAQQEVLTNEKAKALITEISTAIESYPRDNEPAVDLLHNLQQIRNKYRRLCALLKLPYRYTQTNVLSF